MSTPSASSYSARSTIKHEDANYLRSLVLEYLIHHGYTDTARAFVEGNTVRQLDADGDEVMSSDSKAHSVHGVDRPSEADLQLISHRKEVESCILSGRIDDAISFLESHFPAVLTSASTSSSTSTTVSSSTPPANTPVTSKAPSSAPTVKPEDVNVPRTFIASTSLDPTYISLNLRIQSFIEDVRTVPLPAPQHSEVDSDVSNDGSMSSSLATPSPSSSPEPLEPVPEPSNHTTASSTSNPDHSGLSASSIPSESSSISNVTSADPDRPARLITRARKLRAAVRAIPRIQDRTVYEADLRNACGLLAYAIPENAPQPLRGYLDAERRRMLAVQINAAILHYSGKRASPRLESLVRYTSFLWSVLHDRGVRVPAEGPYTPKGQLLGKDGAKVPAPEFNLGVFLDPWTDAPPDSARKTQGSVGERRMWAS